MGVLYRAWRSVPLKVCGRVKFPFLFLIITYCFFELNSHKRYHLRQPPGQQAAVTEMSFLPPPPDTSDMYVRSLVSPIGYSIPTLQFFSCSSMFIELLGKLHNPPPQVERALVSLSLCRLLVRGKSLTAGLMPKTPTKL